MSTEIGRPTGLRTEVEAAFAQLSTVLETARDLAERPEASAKREQFRALSRVVMDLQRKSVPVPEDVRRLVSDLSAELEATDDAEEALAFAADALEQMVRRSSRRRISNGELPTTSIPVMRNLIADVLREHDGTGNRRDVLGWIAARMEGRFLAGDLQETPSGSVYWHHTASNARQMMVREGVMREGSARGVWELDE